MTVPNIASVGADDSVPPVGGNSGWVKNKDGSCAYTHGCRLFGLVFFLGVVYAAD